MRHRQGYILVTSISLVVLLALLGSAYFITSSTDQRTNRALNSSTTGLLAAEAGLNARAPQLIKTLQSQMDAVGTPPDDAAGKAPCTDGNMGTGDFACVTYTFNDRTVHTYMANESFGRLGLRIPSDQPYGGLYSFENRYVIRARALKADGTVEAITGARLKVRELPLFQFTAYFNDDLELSPGGGLSLGGPVHTNGRLYMNASTGTLRFWNTLSAVKGIYRGQKALNGYGGIIPVQGTAINCAGVEGSTGGGSIVAFPTAYTPPNCYPTQPIPNELLDRLYNMRVNGRAPTVNSPNVDIIRAQAGYRGWDSADLRVVMDVRGGSNNAKPEVRRADGTTDSTLTKALKDCNDTVDTVTWNRARPGGFYDGREKKYLNTMEVDVRNLLTCMHTNMRSVGGVALDDATDGGLVWHFSIDANDARTMNNDYAVRLRGGAHLTTNGSAPGAPRIRGLTVVSDQKTYVWGSYNITDKRPAAIMGDTVTVLSNNWSDARSAERVANRVAANSWYNFAVIAGMAESRDFHNNGHLQNFIRFLEDWRGYTFTYRGSLVSLGAPRTTNSPFMYWDAAGDPTRWNTIAYYGVPGRDMSLDPDYVTPEGLPPITPTVNLTRVEDLERTYAR